VIVAIVLMSSLWYCAAAGALKTERVDVGRAAPVRQQQQQYAKPQTGHPTSPAMPSPLTPVDGASFYPSATDVDAKALMLSPRFNDVKPSLISLNTPIAVPEPVAIVANYTQYQQQFVQPGTAASVSAGGTSAVSLLSDLDDIDALQCQWDMKHFEPGKLTESDLVCLDTAPTALSATAATALATSAAPSAVTSPYSTPGPDQPVTFHPVFSSPTSLYHPYYQSQQQLFSSEFNLDYSTPEVKELLCTGWLESDILNVN